MFEDVFKKTILTFVAIGIAVGIGISSFIWILIKIIPHISITWK